MSRSRRKRRYRERRRARRFFRSVIGRKLMAQVDYMHKKITEQMLEMLCANSIVTATGADLDAIAERIGVPR